MPSSWLLPKPFQAPMTTTSRSSDDQPANDCRTVRLLAQDKHGDNHRGKRVKALMSPASTAEMWVSTVSEEGERDAVQQRREDE